jgi:hypothetical protein
MAPEARRREEEPEMQFIADTFENRDLTHKATKERVRALEEAMRRLAWEHGFRAVRSLVSENYEDWDVRVEIECRMDLQIPQ